MAAAVGLVPAACPALDVLAAAGPDVPPVGASLLSEVFPGGLPYPFETVLNRLREVAGEDNVETALIPLGRSLQRYAADPDYFASPRLVVAVTGDKAAGPGTARLADRLFLGYQPAAEVIEAISYNEAAGRFEFQEIVGYDGRPTAARPAERRVCTECHQAGGPIFARPLWAESNANTAIAGRLGALGPSFHGAPVQQTVDGLEAFDAATDRAARIVLADRLWSEGCPDATCRAALLSQALRFALGGAQPGWQAPASPIATAFDARAARLWPEGLAVISPDLPNRDPLLTPGLETTGRLNPETPREPVVLWRPADGFDAAVREVAGQLAPGDVAWIDGLVRQRGGPAETVTLTCTVETVALAARSERRFDCTSGAGSMRGFLDSDGGGRIDALALPGVARAGGLTGLAPRLADGRRMADLSLAGDVATFRLVDDLAPLAAALDAQAAAGATAFAPGPFRRTQVLDLIAALTEAADG